MIVHGYGDNKSGMLDYATFLHDRYNLVVFDLRNSGQSTGELTTQGNAEQRDLAAMLDWVVRTKAPSELVVFGQSMGGHTSISVVARDPRLGALILDSTHDRLATAMSARIGNGATHSARLASLAVALGAWIRSGEFVLGSDPIEAIDELGKRPVLLLQGGLGYRRPARLGRSPGSRRAGGRGRPRAARLCGGRPWPPGRGLCPQEYGEWLNDFLERALGD